MSNASRALAALDRGLARVGQDIILQRMNGAAVASQVTCRAVVRGYAPDELVGGITQQDSFVILSPTQIIAANWKAFAVSGETTLDQRIPIKGNKAVINGKTRNIEAAGGLYVDGELVRIEMRVLG